MTPIELQRRIIDYAIAMSDVTLLSCEAVAFCIAT
ncbi:MAG: hypothetical protein ACI9XK_003044, partial [Granulosicoccus sp.]